MNSRASKIIERVVASPFIVFGVAIFSAVAVFSWKWFVNPLPNDEYMISHFNNNRAAYEELVSGYVDARSKGEDAMKLWLKSPRKIELQRLVKAKDDTFNSESTQWDGGIVANSPVGDRKKTIYSMEFHIEGGSASSIREGSVIWKSYWYFSDQQQQISDEFCWINTKAKKCLAGTMIGILESLDAYPLFPGSDTWCGNYMRQINENWFVGYTKACL
jgi:hypothetical protein